MVRSSLATDLGLSDSEIDEFLSFLSTPELCGLIRYEDGIVTTERTQEDFKRVSAKRESDRLRAQEKVRDNRGLYVSENGSFGSENQEIDSGQTTEQSRVEQSRVEKSRAEQTPAAPDAAAFSLLAFKGLVKFHSSFDFSFGDDTYKELYHRLVVKGCADQDFIEFCIGRMRACPKRIDNPSGFLKTAILSYDDWILEWKQKRKRYSETTQTIERMPNEQIAAGLRAMREKLGQ